MYRCISLHNVMQNRRENATFASSKGRRRVFHRLSRVNESIVSKRMDIVA